MHKRQRIHGMKNETPESASVFRDNFVMVARIGIGDTTAARRHSIDSALYRISTWPVQGPVALTDLPATVFFEFGRLSAAVQSAA